MNFSPTKWKKKHIGRNLRFDRVLDNEEDFLLEDLLIEDLLIEDLLIGDLLIEDLSLEDLALVLVDLSFIVTLGHILTWSIFRNIS